MKDNIIALNILINLKFAGADLSNRAYMAKLILDKLDGINLRKKERVFVRTMSILDNINGVAKNDN